MICLSFFGSFFLFGFCFVASHMVPPDLGFFAISQLHSSAAAPSDVYCREAVCWARLPRFSTLLSVRPETLMLGCAAPLATAGAAVTAGPAAADAMGTKPNEPPNSPLGLGTGGTPGAGVAPMLPRLMEVSRGVGVDRATVGEEPSGFTILMLAGW